MIGRICFVIVIMHLIAFLNALFATRANDCPIATAIYCMVNAGAIGWMISYILVSKGLL